MTTVTKEAYWQTIVNDPTQAGQIATDDAEWNTRAACLFRVLENTLIKRDNAILVQQWEHQLELSPAADASLADRKAACLYKMTCALPITPGLIEKALEKILGAGNFSLTRDTEENKVTVAVSLDTTAAQIAEVESLLDRVLPRNLVTEIDPWPCDLTRLEYLESTGTQYINSEINPGTYVNIDITLSRIKKLATYDVFLGKNQDADVGVSRINIAAYNDYLQTEFGWWNNLGFVITDSQKLHITFESEIGDYAGAKATVNGEAVPIKGDVLYYRGDVSSFTDPLYFYARNTNGGQYAYSCCRVYHCCIKTQTAQATFIPALDKLGTPGLYCPETRTLLTNLGTGDFLYPGKEEETTTYSLRNRMYAQMTEHGIRRLYRVPEGYNSKEEYAEQNGFKILVETPMPEEGYWTPVWHDREDCIELEWVETEAPAEESYS